MVLDEQGGNAGLPKTTGSFWLIWMSCTQTAVIKRKIAWQVKPQGGIWDYYSTPDSVRRDYGNKKQCNNKHEFLKASVTACNCPELYIISFTVLAKAHILSSAQKTKNISSKINSQF